MNQHREYYYRHLPHWQPGEAVFFITFRLKGSLPLEIIKALKEEREREEAMLTKFAQDQQAKQNYLDERHYFVKWDRLLDKAENGPRWLSQPEIAEVIKEALHYRNAREYNLHAFCIMSNHVHAIFEPLEKQDSSFSPLNKIMQSLKRHTARKANIILGREGAFWQDESYDHIVRNNEEFLRIIYYVLENPVKAGLVSKWEDWPWTYWKDSAL